MPKRSRSSSRKAAATLLALRGPAKRRRGSSRKCVAGRVAYKGPNGGKFTRTSKGKRSYCSKLRPGQPIAANIPRRKRGSRSRSRSRSRSASK